MKKVLKYIFITLVLGLIYIVYSNYPRLDIITGFSSKSVASGIFLANRTQKSVEHGDNDFPPINLAKNKVDNSNNSVSSTVFGLKSRTAVYRDGLGVVLVNDDFDSDKKFNIPKRNKTSKNLPYPYGNLPQKDTVFTNVNYENLQKSVNDAFDNNDENFKKTRSVLVIYKDQIIAEKYALTLISICRK